MVHLKEEVPTYIIYFEIIFEKVNKEIDSIAFLFFLTLSIASTFHFVYFNSKRVRKVSISQGLGEIWTSSLTVFHFLITLSF